MQGIEQSFKEVLRDNEIMHPTSHSVLYAAGNVSSISFSGLHTAESSPFDDFLQLD